jgi:DNA repair protein RadC
LKKSFTLHDLPAQERPRERLFKLGEMALSLTELLALIFGRGAPGESVMLLAQKLITKYKNFQGINNASLQDLMTVKGIGRAKAAQIKAVLELAKRAQEPQSYNKKTQIKGPEDVFKIVKKSLKGKKKEYLLAVLLNTRNYLISVSRISVGILNANLIHPREVFKEAISVSASAVIVAHNHPSGDPQPSDEDIRLTKILVKAGAIIGIELIDHIIVSDDKYLSMKEEKMV